MQLHTSNEAGLAQLPSDIFNMKRGDMKRNERTNSDPGIPQATRSSRTETQYAELIWSSKGAPVNVTNKPPLHSHQAQEAESKEASEEDDRGADSSNSPRCLH